MKFVPGREDCPTSPDSDDEPEFPRAHAGSAEVYAYFADHFNFTRKETVAIMNGHCIGQAREEVRKK